MTVETQVNVNWSFGEAFRGFADSLKTLSGSMVDGMVNMSGDVAFTVTIMISILIAGLLIYRRVGAIGS